jgi:hypothetical protein
MTIEIDPARELMAIQSVKFSLNKGWTMLSLFSTVT